MDEDGSCLALTATDDVDSPILVDVDQDGVFGRSHLAGSNARPGMGDGLRSRISADVNDAAFLPAGNYVQQAIIVDICQSHAVRTARGTIDGVPNPGLITRITRRTASDSETN
jgi:hypothetical protein